MGLFDGVSEFVGNVTGGLIGESSAEQAAKDAGQLSQYTTDANIDTFYSYYQNVLRQLSPYVTAGSQAISDLMDNRFGDPDVPELAMFAYPNPESPELDIFAHAIPKTPELQQFVFDATELGGTDAYKWRYQEGLRATDRAQAVNRNLTSGNRLTALMDYGQGSASQEFENEWQRQLKSNLVENERRVTGYEMDVNRFNQQRQQTMDENQRRTDLHNMDIGRFNRERDSTALNNEILGRQYGFDADNFRSVMDRLTGVANSGQTAATNVSQLGMGTASSIAGARGQGAADQFAASLIPVNEKQQYLSGLTDLAGTVFGAR